MVVDVVVVVDVVDSHAASVCNGDVVSPESPGCAMTTETGVATRNNAVTEIASARWIFRCRVKCGAGFKATLPPHLSDGRCSTNCSTRTCLIESPSRTTNSARVVMMWRGESLLTLKSYSSVSQEYRIPVR